MKRIEAIFCLSISVPVILFAASRESKSVPKPLKKVYSQINGQSEVPALIPPGLLKASGPKTMVCISEVNESGYQYSLDMDPECSNSGATHIGSIIGGLVSESGLELKDAIGQIGNEEPMVDVKLTGGRNAIFQEANCGSSCGDSTLGWEEGNYRFLIQMKAGPQEDLVTLANAGIQNWVGDVQPNKSLKPTAPRGP